MEYRPYGTTGLQVAVLGFGAMRIPNKSPAEVTELLTRAVELGVNYIDTAPGYGNSEELLGAALANVNSNDLVISTKTHVDSDKDADAVRRRVEDSLRRMNISQITILQMWGVNNWEMAQKVLAPGGPLEGARKLQEEGIVKHIGFTTHALPEDALKIMQTGEFVAVTGRYHYLDPVYAPLLEKAAELGMAFIAMTPLGQGWLAKPSPALSERLEGQQPVDFALRWIAVHRGVTSIIVGLSTIDELEAAYHALGGEVGDAASLIATGERIHQQMAVALGKDYCTVCRNCLPCPQQINIPELLRLNNLLRGYQLVEWCKDRYKFMGNAGSWYPGVKADHCTECGDCEPRCPQGLPIIALLKALHEDLFEGERGRMSKEG
ncbi:MAG: aldo/keto reductase [Candidatus Zipacnadales bacterium]